MTYGLGGSHDGHFLGGGRSYFGYFGTFTIDASARAVTHHIDTGWFPTLLGQNRFATTRSRTAISFWTPTRRGGKSAMTWQKL
ncbi:MAG: lipocalin-like domain-containing protein [Pseudonocardiales bacterium]|nr:lipocalin-like domain-containing protein [Pseudonocardiales bacterium]